MVFDLPRGMQVQVSNLLRLTLSLPCTTLTPFAILAIKLVKKMFRCRPDYFKLLYPVAKDCCIFIKPKSNYERLKHYLHSWHINFMDIIKREVSGTQTQIQQPGQEIQETS